MAENPRRGLTVRNENRLVRQVGKSNLIAPEEKALKQINVPQAPRLAPRPQAVKKKEEASFEVFVDPDTPCAKENIGMEDNNICTKENDTTEDNNIIHMLERKCKEEAEAQHKQVPKNKSPQKTGRRPLAPLKQSSSFTVYESDDEDLFSAQSQLTNTTCGSIRANLLGLTVRSELAPIEKAEEVEEVEEEPELEGAVDVQEYFVDVNRLYNAPDFDEDIYQYMRHRETKIRAKSDYLKRQKDMTVEMRKILVDWLSDVITEYNLSQETFHLSVSLLDRTLSRFHIDREKLQLVGAASMMIASKFEEVYPPTPKEFVYLTEDTYTIKQLQQMERAILSELKFEVCAPTASWFAKRLATTLDASVAEQIENAYEYLLDLTLMDTSFLDYKPSYVGAACLSYALVLYEHEAWNTALEKHSGILLQYLEKAFLHIDTAFKEAPLDKFSAIYSHYMEPSKNEVSLLQPPKTLPFSR